MIIYIYIYIYVQTYMHAIRNGEVFSVATHARSSSLRSAASQSNSFGHLRQWFYEGRKPIALQHGLRLAVIGTGSIGYFSFGQLATQDGFNKVWQPLHLELFNVVKLCTFALFWFLISNSAGSSGFHGVRAGPNLLGLRLVLFAPTSCDNRWQSLQPFRLGAHFDTWWTTWTG